ncbi:MAG: RNA polymerase sigma factor [Phycisphaerae bacterium]|nr:RNA polymerase sigma factor [Phycisphaerae bacterium]
MAAAVVGDTEALTELLRLHGPSIERSLQIQEIWRAALEPADVMQVTYLEAFLQIRNFDPARGTPFRAWLLRIAQNNLRDAIRSLERLKQPQPRDRIKPSTREQSMTGLLDTLDQESATPSRSVGRREAISQLESAIATLPERYAEVVRLYDLEGLSIDDVSRRLNRSSGAVHMMRARAHERLRVCLNADHQ